MKKAKRFFGAFLALCLALGGMTVPAWAHSHPGGDDAAPEVSGWAAEEVARAEKAA